MSCYTMKFQNIAKKYKDEKTLNDKITKIALETFPTEYPKPATISMADFKKFFETQFISYYFFDEIAFETFEEFKLRLDTFLNLKLPAYCKLLDVFYTISNDIFLQVNKTVFDGNTNTENTNGEKVTKNENGERQNSTINGEQNSQTNVENVVADLPINLITTDNIDSVNYATNGQKNKTNTKNNQFTNTQIYQNYIDKVIQEMSKDNIENLVHNETITTGSIFQFLSNYNANFKNILIEMFQEFEPLFLWIF